MPRCGKRLRPEFAPHNAVSDPRRRLEVPFHASQPARAGSRGQVSPRPGAGRARSCPPSGLPVGARASCRDRGRRCRAPSAAWPGRGLPTRRRSRIVLWPCRHVLARPTPIDCDHADRSRIDGGLVGRPHARMTVVCINGCGASARRKAGACVGYRVRRRPGRHRSTPVAQFLGTAPSRCAPRNGCLALIG